MDGLIIGVDLCDSYTHILCQEPEQMWSLPTRIGKDRDSDAWYVAETAAENRLEGMVVEDKLLSLAAKNGTATIDGVRYEGLYLLKMFLKQALSLPKRASGKDGIASLVITVPEMDVKLMDCLMYCADFLEIDRGRVHIISHTESFVYYVMSQKREVWSNQVGMFELSEDGLRYYELKVQRSLRQMQVLADQEELEETFHLNVLESQAGVQMADRILSSCAERLLQKRLFSAVILTGKGFDSTDWAPDFMQTICHRRRVFAETEVFARGALNRAVDACEVQSSYNFTCICEGRLKSTISLKIQEREKEGQLVLAAAGDSWYEAKTTAEFIVAGEPEVEFLIQPMEPRKKKIVKIPLDGFPRRPDRTTRIEMSLGFTGEDTMIVMIRDLGFGELFPATNRMIKQEVSL